MRSSRGATVVRVITLAVIVLWSVGPIYAGVVTSLSRRTDVQAVPAHWWPSPISLDGYRALLPLPGGSSGTESEARPFATALLTSAEIAGVATLLSLVMSVFAGYAFGRLRFPGRRTALTGIVATFAIPLFVVIVPLFRIMSTWHLIDTKVGLVLLYVTAYAPLGIWLFYNYVADVPVVLLESPTATPGELAGLADTSRAF